MHKAKYPQICRVKVVVSNARVLALTLIHEPIPRVLQPHNDFVPLSYFLVQHLLSVVCFLELFRDFGWVSRHHSWWWVSFLPFAVFFVLSNDVLFLTFYSVFCILLSWRCLFFTPFCCFCRFLEKLWCCHHTQSWGVLFSVTLRIHFIDWLSRLCLFQIINGAFTWE